MEQSIREEMLKYMRQKYDGFYTSPTSPSYSHIISELSSILRSHHPQEYPNGHTAYKDAKALTDELCVKGNKREYCGSTRGRTDIGWSDMQGRLSKLVQKRYF